MDVCALGSGSKGNCVYIEGGGTAVLVDAGLTSKELLRRMALAKIDPAKISAILFTHDHTDHCDAIAVFHKHLHATLYANAGTSEGIDRVAKTGLSWTLFETSQSMDIGELHVEPFPVSHDASDPVGFIFSNGASRLFYATDLGCVTQLVRQKIKHCTAAVLESNHDHAMLMDSKRAWSLKMRIAGRSGHLSNEDAAAFIRTDIPAELHTLLLAHLSEECNAPSLARSVMTAALQEIHRTDVRVETLSQITPSEHFIV